jgi:hypothetical protein
MPALITYAESIVKAMTGNPAFPTPNPTLAAITTAIAELQAAETATVARTKGAIVVRNDKRVALVALLQQLKSYIQQTADANPENGGAIIRSAGIATRKTVVRAPRVFVAKPAGVTGAVKLVAPSAARRASYSWEYSLDSGTTWVSLPDSLQAKTTVQGLKAGTTVLFKYRPVVKTGEENWSPAVSLLVQ